MPIVANSPWPAADAAVGPQATARVSEADNVLVNDFSCVYTWQYANMDCIAPLVLRIACLHRDLELGIPQKRTASPSLHAARGFRRFGA